MTATDTLLAQNTGAFGTTAGASSPKFNVNDIVMHFGREYYTMLSMDPERLHCFYGKQSSLLHCQEEDVDAPVFVGLEEIHNRIMAMGYHGARVVISNIDCQPSMNGCILIFVLGTMHWPSGAVRKFVQTFVLAEQPNGYFVLNDIMRLMKEAEPRTTTTATTTTTIVPQPSHKQASCPSTGSLSSPTPITCSIAATGAAGISVPDQPSKSAVESHPSTTSEMPKAGESPIKNAKSTPAKQESSSSPHPTKISSSSGAHKKTSATAAVVAAATAPAATTTESNTPTTPSSWAKLAAVQQNRWQSGVVADAKGPVASIPIPTSSTDLPLGGGSSADGQQRSGGRVSYRTGDRRERPDRTTERTDRNEGNGNNARRNSDDYDPAKSIYVSRIAGRIERQALMKVFEKFGAIKSFDCVFTKGIAFVEFENADAQAAALKTTLTYNNEPMQVEARRAPRSKESANRPASTNNTNSSRRLYRTTNNRDEK